MEAGFSPGVTTLLDRADTACSARGARLTDTRREVLGHILSSPAPIGAYDLLERLRGGRRAAPPTVYRALEFLQEHGLVHRIERLSAFVGCVAEDEHSHAAQFLICTGCGRATEIDDHELAHALGDAARRAGFKVARATIEAEGLCAACA
jgi:Fur family zinc uptake transcriptional regulator